MFLDRKGGYVSQIKEVAVMLLDRKGGHVSQIKEVVAMFMDRKEGHVSQTEKYTCVTARNSYYYLLKSV